MMAQLFQRVQTHKQVLCLIGILIFSITTHAATLMAGVAKVDITDYDAGPVSSPMYARALVLKSDTMALTIVTVDAVAIGGIGRITDDYLPTVRTRLEKELGINPQQVLINASHCHGIIVHDVADRTVQAVTEASKNLVPVTIGAGAGHEDRVMENRRFLLKNGDQVDSRRAYSLPPDETFESVGPVDPEVGVLRLDKVGGGTMAVVYNFACHPIQGVPHTKNTADMTGFSSSVIEDNIEDGGVALFIQGCGGDINPAFYKDVEYPHDAEPLGNMLGLSTLKAVKSISPKEDTRLSVISETLVLPRANFEQRIKDMEALRITLLDSLQGSTINFKTFYPMMVKYTMSDDFPSHYAHRYLHEEMLESGDLNAHDTDNRNHMARYLKNIYIMEELTRVQANLRLLNMHQKQIIEAKSDTISVEVMAVRIGDFVMVTFPGELTVQIGLNIKAASPHDTTFVAGYTNGYIYYAPTAEQLRNTGHAQEDCDTLLAPEWQAIFEAKVAELLKGI